MPAKIVEVQDLTRRFGSQTALDQVSLEVEKGHVYGLVGVNGAGKTTLIKHLLGLLRAKEGTVRVFGLDPASHPVEVLQRIGYLSEEREMPEWMSINELMRYTAAFHPKWDQSYAQSLLESFRLDGKKKVKHLSKGMRAQTGLIAAVSHRPDLLLLDEPSTGLDPVVRKDILNAIVRTVADEGRTAIFSSHLLDEVELMSDYVFMINQGKLVLQGVLDDIKQQHQVLSIRFDSSTTELPSIEGVLTAERRGSSFYVVMEGTGEHTAVRVSARGGEVMQQRSASLQEIFVARAGRELLVESN
jgi:ABC-2 type transport system ATP-binding protein